MTNDKDDRSKTDHDALFGGDSVRRGQPRHDPSFSAFAEPHDDDYEEPERDTDFDTTYQTDSVEEDEELDDDFPETDEDNDSFLFGDDAAVPHDLDPEDEEESDSWLEKEEVSRQQGTDSRRWPWGLIAVAIVAIVLLAAGGYGVMQQRAATDAELQRLRAALATAASPEQVRASRDALQEMQQSYDKLRADADALALENRRLADTLAGLEAQLDAQQSTLSKAAPAAQEPKAAVAKNSTSPRVTAKPVAPPPAAPKPAAPAAPVPTPVQAPAKPAAATSTASASGPWFVNFGSYAARSMAETWASRLHPVAGKVIIAPNTSGGQTLYRVRIVGLPSRDAAKEVARRLEADQRVSELWVGKE